MMRVVTVVDKEGTALDRLAKGVIPYHQNLDYHVVDVHPKRPDPSQLHRFESLAKTADVIDYQYFRSAEKLREMYPWLKDIPSVLTHNNAYSHRERDWNDYNVSVGNNLTLYEDLKKITTSRVEHIPLAIDQNFWTFNQEYKYPRSVIMVANRIESKKGILPVAKACKALDIKMYLVGAISDPNYWKEIMELGNVEFAQECSDEILRDLYHKSGIHVCNSVDNFESGTLPILEAIACGVPVLTRKVGHVPDFMTETNIKINHHAPDDVEHIARLLNEMFADKKSLDIMRNEAWMAIKHMNFDRRAYAYQKLYRELLTAEPVSVIVPVCNKPEVTAQCLNAVANQTYPNIELIVVDDGESQKNIIDDFAQTVSIPVRYIKIDSDGYNLAKARNLGIIEATSDILVFCDQRMILDNNCIDEFVRNLQPRHWLYGNKGSKKDFVENVSCINRTDIVSLGMFNERITEYGGMSQECRARARLHGFSLDFIETAKAVPYGKSNNKHSKRYEIMRMKNLLWKIQLT